MDGVAVADQDRTTGVTGRCHGEDEPSIAGRGSRVVAQVLGARTSLELENACLRQVASETTEEAAEGFAAVKSRDMALSGDSEGSVTA